MQFDKEASQTRDYWVAENATLRAARPDSSPRKERLFGMTIELLEERAECDACPRVTPGRIIRLAFTLRASGWDRLHNSNCFWEECVYASTCTERF